MNKIKLLVFGFLLTSAAFVLKAQSQTDMRLNELLVHNTADFEDDYGQHNGWVELFNVSYGTVDIGGCFLSNDPGNLQKYSIPKGDVLTKIKPRQHTLFWTDNQPFHGTFHTNFTLEESDSVFFVASDGKTIIDRICVPKDLKEDQSYGRNRDGTGSINGSGEGWEIRDRTSPSTNNFVIDNESKSMSMKKTDPYGTILTITAMSVVFLALLVLCLIFKFTGHLSIKNLNKRSYKAMSSKGKTAPKVSKTTSETYAAIGMALHLYNEENQTHDDESLIITLTHPDKRYSPWSAKIYGLRQVPEVTKKQR